MKTPAASLPRASQRVFEDFCRYLRENPISADVSAAEYAGSVVRAAVAVSWLTLDVDNADPLVVNRLKNDIFAFSKEVLADPLSPSSPSPTTSTGEATRPAP